MYVSLCFTTVKVTLKSKMLSNIYKNHTKKVLHTQITEHINTVGTHFSPHPPIQGNNAQQTKSSEQYNIH